MSELNDFIKICPDLTDDRTGALPCTHYITGGFCTTPNHFRCLEYIARNEPPLSYSAISDYAACHRKFYWSWMLGVEALERPWAMQLGLFASTILGWLHDFKVPSDVAVARYGAYIDKIIKESANPDDDQREFGHPDLWKMKAVFDAYIQLEIPWTDRGVTEYEFRWNFDGLPKLHGFIDMLDKGSGEGFKGWEYKYTGNPDNFNRIAIMDQLITYFLSDPEILSITNRCFCYPGFWLKKGRGSKPGENIFDFYQRCKDEALNHPKEIFLDRKYYRNEFDLENYKMKVRRVTREIMSYIREGTMEPFYQNKKNCFNPWPCTFLKCCEMDLTEPWQLTNTYRKKSPRR